MELYTQITPPANAKANNIPWYSYSDDFYRYVPLLKKALQKAGAPQLIRQRGYGEYNYTYNCDVALIGKGLNAELAALPKALIRFPLNASLLFFDRMINSTVDIELFHFLFAYLSSSLKIVQQYKMASLYAPISPEGEGDEMETDFPLHCDLYIPQILFNIFEDASPGKNDGVSTFVTTKDLTGKIMPGISSINTETINEANSLLHVEKRKDRYDAFFTLLYAKENVWSTALKQKLYKKAIKQKFEKGQGYMINDRLWMHGRGPCKATITSKRLHRLIFNNAETA